MFPFAIIPPFVIGGNEFIKNICCITNDTMLLTTKGNVYVTGQNRIGELGVGDASDRYDQWVLVMQDVNHIAAIREKLYAVKADGAVYTPAPAAPYNWESTTAWEAAGDLSGDNIKQVISDSENIFVWKKDKSLYYMGNNSKGQGNTGGTSVVSTMRLHTTDVVDISVSGDTVVVLKSDGYLWGVGNNGRNIIGPNSTYLSLAQMFGTHADGGTIEDFMTTNQGTALLVRYSNGKYRTKGLNIGQLPSGTASPYGTLTDVPDGFTPGNGTEPLIKHVPALRNGGTYPSYSYNMFYYTGGEIYANGAATGYLTGVNQGSGTLAQWTMMDSSSVRLANMKGMSFGMGWAIAYSDTEIIYWGGNGSTTIKPIPGWVADGRPQYQARFAISPLAA